MTCRLSSREVVPLLFVLFGLSGIFGLSGVNEANAHPGHWCGREAADWLCRQAGRVKLEGRRRRTHRPIALNRGAAVWVGANGEARATFSRDAFCTIGGVATPTEIVSRFESSLFRQLSGATSCTSRREESLTFGFFCDLTEPCPAMIWANGKIVSQWTGSDAGASSTVEIEVPEIDVPEPPEVEVPNVSAADPATRRELISVICSGSYRIVVDRGSSRAESSGSVSGRNRTLVRIIEEGNSGLSLSTITTSGPCRPPQ